MVRLRTRIVARHRLSCYAPLALPSRRRPAQAEPRAVIELFTSQGCSSCPPADKLIARICARSLCHRAEPRGRLLGLSRLEGHACAARPFQPPARLCQGARRPRSLHAAGRDQRRGPRARQRQGRDRARDRADTRAERTVDASGEARAERRQVDGDGAGAKDEKGRPRSGCVRSPGRCRSRSAAAKTAATPSPTQRGAALDQARRLDRHGRNLHVPVRDVQSGGIDAVAVVVQSGTASARSRCSARSRSLRSNSHSFVLRKSRSEAVCQEPRSPRKKGRL